MAYGAAAVANLNAPRRVRVWQPPDLTLARAPIGGGAIASLFTVPFGFPTPDARVLLKVSILFYQEVTGQASQNVIPFDVSIAGTATFALSLQRADRVATGAYVPTENIVGAGRSAAQMQQIPLVVNAPNVIDNLNGFTVDIQGGQDAVVGAFNYNNAIVLAKGLVVVARGRYNLVQAEMCDDEWEAARAQMSPWQAPAVIGP